MSERLEQIKQYTTINRGKQGDKYIVYKDDLHWMIAQIKKYEEEIEQLKEENEELRGHMQYLADDLERYINGLRYFKNEERD